MQSTTLHEAVPGHHMQLALQQEMQNVPEFRKVGASFQTLLFLFLLVIPPFLASCSLANGQPTSRVGPYIQRA